MILVDKIEENYATADSSYMRKVLSFSYRRILRQDSYSATFRRHFLREPQNIICGVNTLQFYNP